MPKYVMKKGNKKHPFDGFRNKILENGKIIKERVELVFEPQKVITTDIDFDHWVRSGYLVKLKEEEKYKENITDETDDKIENILVVSPKNMGFENLEDKIDNETDIDNKKCEVENEIEDEEDDADDKIEKDNDSNEDDIKYEKIEDGFRCIICGKILKSEKRMSTHIRKKHSKLESN